MKASELLLNLIYPPFCVMCGELLPIGDADDALCETCHAKWQKAREARCPDCRRSEAECCCTPSELHRLNAECAHLVPYQQASDAVGRVLLTAKDERYHTLFNFFGRELSERLAQVRPPVARDALITWLPRSRSKAAETGVDQAKEMAKALAKYTGLQVTPLFDRVRGGMQKELTADERLSHARASYRLRRKGPPLGGRTVVTVDDIFTTGATMLATAELLRAHGAGRIICLTVAKTRSKLEKE